MRSGVNERRGETSQVVLGSREVRTGLTVWFVGQLLFPLLRGEVEGEMRADVVSDFLGSPR